MLCFTHILNRWRLRSVVARRGKKAQSQGIGDHGNRTHGHGPTGDHGIQGRPAEEMKNSRCHRYADNVVDKGPEEILLDIAHGGAA